MAIDCGCDNNNRRNRCRLCYEQDSYLLPALFPQPAFYPYIDATATVMGFVAAGLMTHRKIEAWILWLCVNSICIGLYYARDVKFVAILYIFFLAWPSTD